MRELVETLALLHANALLAVASAAAGAWAALFVGVPAVACAAFLAYVAAKDAAGQP